MRRSGPPRLGSGGLLLGLCGCSGVPSDHFPVTAQRPIFSTDTATAAPGTLELQAGIADAPDQFTDLPVQLNFGAGERTEVFVGFSPYQEVQSAAGTESGVANLVLGARRRLLDETEARPSVAVQGFVKFPTRKLPDELGTGKTDFAVAGTATRTIGPDPRQRFGGQGGSHIITGKRPSAPSRGRAGGATATAPRASGLQPLSIGWDGGCGWGGGGRRARRRNHSGLRCASPFALSGAARHCHPQGANG